MQNSVVSDLSLHGLLKPVSLNTFSKYVDIIFIYIYHKICVEDAH